MAIPLEELYSFDPTSIMNALKTLNKAVRDSTGQMSKDAQDAFNVLDQKMIQITNRQTQAQNALVRSWERRASLAGRSGVERIIADADREIKKLGQNKEAIDRLIAARNKLIEVERKGGGGPGDPRASIQQFGQSVQLMLQNPLYGAQSAVGRLTSSLGPLGVALGVATATLIGAGIAGIKAAESIGRYAMEIRNAEIQTGLTAEQVVKFGYAARASGTNLESYARMMRGLSEALGDFSQRGEKGRGIVEKLLGGKSLFDVQGNIKGLAELLPALSEGLAKNANIWEKDAEAIALFRRVGITSLPELVQLNDLLKDAEKLHPLGEQQISELQGYYRQVTLLTEQWKIFKAEFLTPIVANIVIPSMEYIIKNWLHPGAGNINPSAMGSGNWAGPNVLGGTQPLLPVPGVPFRVGSLTGPAGTTQAISSSMMSALASETAAIQPVIAAARVAATGSVGGPKAAIEKQLQDVNDLKKAYDAAQNTLRLDLALGQRNTDVLRQHTNEANRTATAYEHARTTLEAMQKLDAQRTANAERLRKLEEEIGMYMSKGMRMLTPSQTLYQEIASRPGISSSDLQRAASLLQPLFNQEGIAARDKFVSQQQEQMEKEAAFGPVFRAPTNARELAQQIMENRNAEQRAFQAGLARETAELEHQNKLIGDALTFDVKRREVEESSALRVRQTRDLGESGASKLRYAQQESDIRMRFMKEEFDIQMNMAAADKDAADKQHELRMKYYMDEAQLRSELSEKQAMIEREQMEKIIGPLQGIFSTLMTHPTQFPQVLRQTVQNAAVSNLSRRLAERAAPGLYPLFFGRHSQDDIQRTTDAHTEAMNRHTAALTAVVGASGGSTSTSASGAGGTISSGTTAAMLGRMGIAPGLALTMAAAGRFIGPRLGLPTGSGAGMSSGVILNPFGGGGIVLPNVPGGSDPGTDAAGAPLSMQQTFPMAMGGNSIFGQLGGLGQLAQILGAPGGTAPFGGGTVLGGGGGLNRGLSGLFNFGGLHNMGGFFGIGTANKWVGPLQPGQTAGASFGTSFGSVAASPAAGLAGGMLASASLMPGSRWAGTPMGILGGTAGGALIGAQFGPIGAAIGAGVGFGIGLGEFLAGVEPQWKEAQRLVKQQYGIHIDHTTGQQIADIANSRYARHVSVAVHSPEVRQMLGLYSAATGQSMALSASTPHPFSLVESGGKLYQQAVYQYGKPYAFNTPLPIFGGVQANTIPSPGGVNLSLNIGDKGAADFMNGRVVTSDNVQSKWSQAQYASNGRTDASSLFQNNASVIIS